MINNPPPTRRPGPLLFFAAALFISTFEGCGKSSKAPVYQTAAADRGTLVARVTASGTLSALVTVQVGSQISGRIEQLYANYNSQVKKGQLLARIDPEFFGAALAQAQANLVAAQGNLSKAKAQAEDAKLQYDRAQRLFSEKLIGQADLDTARAGARAAEAQVEASSGSVAQARAGVAQAQVNFRYTSIYSPINGMVISRTVDVGQTVAASLSAPVLFTIAEDLRKMQVDTSVSESDVGKLKAGAPAEFTVDAWPGEKFRGAIREVRNAPQTLQNVVTYDAVIDVDNAELKLKPGMTANVTIIHARRDDALRVANAALRFKPPPEMLKGKNAAGRGGQSAGAGNSAAGGFGAPAVGRSQGEHPRGDGGHSAAGERGGGMMPGDDPPGRLIWVLRDNQPQPVRVQTGVTDGSNTEVTGGDLREGDLVITDLASSGMPAGGAPGGMRRSPF